MKILVITNDSLGAPDYQRIFADFVDPDDVEIRCGIESGKDFILNRVIGLQKHLDIIILKKENSLNSWENYFQNFDAVEFALWLRGLTETYSSHNFQVATIPIVLDDRTMWVNPFYSQEVNDLEFDGTPEFDLKGNFQYYDERILVDVFCRPINNWLNRLGDELDNADLDTQFDFKRSLVPKKDTFDTKILSKSFFHRLRKLNYVWIGEENINALYVNVDLFKKMVDETCRNKSIRNEKDFHAFLRKNVAIVQGENYYKSIYENHFYYGFSRKYVEPDFVNLNYSHSFHLPQIFEVKLPNQQVLKISEPELNQYFKKSVSQVEKKYFEYFTNLDFNLGNIKQAFQKYGDPLEERDFSKIKFKYTLLIGRQAEKEENHVLINKHIEGSQSSIDVLSYDELLSKYQKVYNRINRFNLR